MNNPFPITYTVVNAKRMRSEWGQWDVYAYKVASSLGPVQPTPILIASDVSDDTADTLIDFITNIPEFCPSKQFYKY